MNQLRQPAGTPVGGQFATGAREEQDFSAMTPSGRQLAESDHTEYVKLLQERAAGDLAIHQWRETMDSSGPRNDSFPSGVMVDNHNRVTGETDLLRPTADGRLRPVLSRDPEAEKNAIDFATEEMVRPVNYQLSDADGMVRAVDVMMQRSGGVFDASLPGTALAMDHLFYAVRDGDKEQIRSRLEDVMTQQCAEAKTFRPMPDFSEFDPPGKGVLSENERGRRIWEGDRKELAPAKLSEVSSLVRSDLRAAVRAGWIPPLEYRVSTRGNSINVEVDGMDRAWLEGDRQFRRTPHAEAIERRIAAIRGRYNHTHSDGPHELTRGYFGSVVLNDFY